jgi:hypothetical protein
VKEKVPELAKKSSLLIHLVNQKPMRQTPLVISMRLLVLNKMPMNKLIQRSMTASKNSIKSLKVMLRK